MRRALLATAAALTLIGVAGPAVASAGTEVDDKHICVMTDTQKREGYCVKTYGVPVPSVGIPKLPDLPDRP